MVKVSIFIATRSKRKALAVAEKRGIAHPIAVKSQGGYVVYSAYRNPAKRKARAPVKRAKRNPSKLFVLEIMRDPARGWKPVAATHSLESARWLAKLIHRDTGLAVHVTD